MDGTGNHHVDDTKFKKPNITSFCSYVRYIPKIMMMTLITMMMIITIIIMGHKRGTLWRRNQ
jgi:hypothetical protein